MKARVAHQTVSFKKDTEHNMEFVAEQNGVTYINDSASIDIKQTIRSIDGIDAELVLVIGGNDERTDYTWFLNIGLQKIKAVIYLGRDPEKIFRLFGKYDCLFVTAISIEEAVGISKTIAKQDQAVLFSPACSSYEAFDNYKNRGNLFKQLVLKAK
jgi:UDP-N-acetylmuramoylalanine--D-glutamate ligase